MTGLASIRGIKQRKGYKDYLKIRIADYRIGVYLKGGLLILRYSITGAKFIESSLQQ